MKGALKLDEEQQRAAESEGSVAVIAGPGSGKTRTLVAKAELESKKNNQRILALTFTRNAAQEIRSRAPKLDASTIHSLCFRHLGKFPGDYESLLDEFLLSHHKPKYDLILIDEFQDLTDKELKVVLSVTKPSSRLFFVGDNNQAIFGYCDAEGSQISKTRIKKIYLTKNYRSSTAILDRLEKINPMGLKAVQRNGNYRIKGTAVLFRENSQMDAVAYKMMELEYNFTIRKRGLKYPGEVIGDPEEARDLILSTIHCSKGREWQRVFCWDWGMRLLEKNLYYVAVARASREFRLINSISELVKGLKQ